MTGEEFLHDAAVNPDAPLIQPPVLDPPSITNLNLVTDFLSFRWVGGGFHPGASKSQSQEQIQQQRRILKGGNTVPSGARRSLQKYGPVT